jgi:ribosomal protein S18 acetylase RimI-like enzyme
LEFGEIDFKTIEKIWLEQLWPERKSKIEPISVINSTGQIDMSIQEIAKPKFVAGFDNGKIEGVSSYFMTAGNEWRLRGTWVSENCRGQGIGGKLIGHIFNSISSTNSSARIWTMARITSISFYQRNDFVKYGSIASYEYGPHALMSRQKNGN